MKLAITREWFDGKARNEGDLEIAAGILARDPSPADADEPVTPTRIAGVQILQRPMLLLDAVRKFDLRALYLPDRKRILLDQSQPDAKQRWNEAHEIGHSLLPWHADLMLGDHEQSLTPGCHAQVEAEANYTAGQLLFLQA